MATRPEKMVKVLPKGQITVPASFRDALDISENSFLKAYLKGGALILKPIKVSGKRDLAREYSKKEINKFLEEDKLDKKTAKRAKRFLEKLES